MVAVRRAGARWPEAVSAAQKEIEATNARIEKEWERLRAADAGLPEGELRLDAGGWAVPEWEGRAENRPHWAARLLGDDYNRQVERLIWRINAVMRGLDVICQWLDAVMARLPEGLNLRDEEVKAVLNSLSPSVEDIEYLILETADHIREIKGLIHGIKHPLRRAFGRVLILSAVLTFSSGVGVGLAFLGNWIGKMV